MNDALKEAQAVDPAWAKKEGRRRAILGLLTAGVLIALAVGVPALVIGFHNGTEITKVETKIEHSACQVQPAGKECQKTKAESAEAANLRVTCIPFFKAGYPCPKPGSTAAGRESLRKAHRAHSVQGGDATSAPTGSSQPGRHEGGSAPENGGSTDQPSHPHAPSVPHQSGGHEAGGGHGSGPGSSQPPAAAPTAPSAPSPPGTSSSSTTERSTETTVVEPAPEPEAPVRTGLGSVVESVGSTVEGAGEAVGGTVEELGHGVNEVVGGLGCQLTHTC